VKRYGDLIADGGSNILEQVEQQRERLKGSLVDVAHVVAVMSGKGGVGKSSVTVNLASALALGGYRVGIIDADINGACIAQMTGVSGETPVSAESGMLPVETTLGIKVMGIDLLMQDDGAPVMWAAPTQKDAFTWRGMMEVAAIREFVSDTVWGELDILLVDLPPGTERLPNLLDVLPRFSGAVVVTLPTQISRLVVGRSIRMATEVLNTPVIGLVENMSARECPHCGKVSDQHLDGTSEEMAEHFGIPFLGSIPFDSNLARAADDGDVFLDLHPESDAAAELAIISRQVLETLQLDM
jgi:ATP-binding protein involved in chromosome partitioning